MKIKDAIAILSKLNPETLLVVSSDSEGNGYGEVQHIEDNAKFHDGCAGIAELTPELVKQGFTDEDVMHEGQLAVILYP